MFIGHGTSQGVNLGVDDSGFDVLFDSNVLVDRKWQTLLDEVRDRLTRDATFDILACRVATGARFGNELAKRLRVQVRSFTEQVCWCREMDDEEKITKGPRGYIALDVELEPYRERKQPLPPCRQSPWKKGIDAIFENPKLPPDVFRRPK